MKKKTENVVFRAALEPLEAAAIKAKAPAPRGALHQAKSVWQRLEGTGGQRQNLGQIDIAVFIQRHADADLGIAPAQDVAPMAGRGDQRRLRLFDGRMMGDVLPGCGIRIAQFGEHIAHIAVCRGNMREIPIVAHIFGFEARNAAERRINRQFRQIII